MKLKNMEYYTQHSPRKDPDLIKYRGDKTTSIGDMLSPLLLLIATIFLILTLKNKINEKLK